MKFWTHSHLLFRLIFLVIILLTILITRIITTRAVGTTYYVDKDSIGGTCNDNNDGTSLTTPFCTFTKAHSVVVAGDIVNFRAATYPSMLITKSGTSGNYLVFQSYTGETAVVDAAGASYGIRTTNTRYVEIKGFEVKNAGGDASGGIYLKGQPITGTDYTLTLSSHNRIINNVTHHNNATPGNTTNGIFISDSSYNVVEGNTIYNNYWSGITIDGNLNVTSEGNQIIGNTIYNNTEAGGNSDGININGARNTTNLVSGNTIYGNADDGIDMWSSNGSIIEKNIVYNHNGIGDGNGIKAGGSTTGGNHIVRYNISYNNKTNGFDSNGSGGNQYYNNIAYNNGAYGFEDGWREVGSTGCDPFTSRCHGTLKNNIGFNNATANLSANEETIVSNNNLWYSTSTGNARISYDYVVYNSISAFSIASGTGLDSNSLSADPAFINAASFNFRLLSTSTAINAGLGVGSTSDYVSTSVPQGSAPDIGAYEFLIPANPISTGQFKTNGTTPIANAAWTNETTVVIKFTMSSTNSSDILTPEVELRDTNGSFTNSVTHSGSPVAFSGTPVEGLVTITGLSTNTQYKAQVRTSNSAGQSAWISVGANPNFGVDTTSPTVPGTPNTSTPTTDTTPVWTWTASTDAGSGLINPAYTLEWSQSATFLSGITSSTINTNNFTHSTALALGTWYFRVKATDALNHQSAFSTGGSVVIEATNNAPTNISLSANTINENAAVSTVIGGFSTTDPDGDSVFTYTFQSNPGGYFGISGNNLIIATALPNVPAATYDITVRSSDGGSLFFDKVFTINVTAQNDSPTNINLSVNSVNETSAEGSIIGTLSSTDPDGDSSFTYTIQSNPGNYFGITGSNLVLVDSLPDNPNSTYNLTVRTTDSGGLYFDKVISLTVTKQNDAPTNIAISTNTVLENVSAGTIIGSLSTSDPDLDTNFSYSLLLNEGGYFSINGNNVLLLNAFGSVHDSQYAITIRSTDSGGLYIDRSFIIDVVDVVISSPNPTPTPIPTSAPTTLNPPTSIATTMTRILKIKLINELGNPLPFVKLVLHSNVIESQTNAEGIAIFNNVEVGDHRLEIYYNNKLITRSILVDSTLLSEQSTPIELNIVIEPTDIAVEATIEEPLENTSSKNTALIIPIILIIGFIVFIVIKAKNKFNSEDTQRI